MKEVMGYVCKRMVPFLLPLIVVLLSGFILASPSSFSASTTANASVTVGSACTFTGTVSTAHNAEVPNGTNRTDIGSTVLNTICNDNGGFAIYAVGYSSSEYGNNTMINQADNTITFNTGTSTSGNNSNWSMKLAQVTTGAYATTIDNSFNSYHNVPATYTKVAHRDSVTDASSTNPAVGSSISLTYQTYISGTQAAGTYQGKVKFTMVHPASATPAQPQETASGQICYYANASDAIGAMGCQNVASSVTLLASNFSRTGYGFAGWSDAYDYASNPNANFYGPQETISLTPADYQSPNKGLSLYAVWVKSNGSLQGWSGCPSLTKADTATNILTQSITALTDQRDNNTYAIARLADGKCWMIENLRLESTNSDNRTGTLAQGYGGQFEGLADAEPAWANDSTTANSLYYSGTQDSTATIDIGTSSAGYRFPRYNHDNTNSRASSPTTNSNAMYSYGNYYTWHAAIADTTAYTSNNTSVTDTSICPSGWHLPIGGTYANATNSEFWLLGLGIMGVAPSNNSQYTSSETNAAGKTATAAFRSYPNNFVYSGYVGSGSVGSRGSYGGYWSSTAGSSSNAYYLVLSSSGVSPGTYSLNKYVGRTVRCVVSGV